MCQGTYQISLEFDYKISNIADIFGRICFELASFKLEMEELSKCE